MKRALIFLLAIAGIGSALFIAAPPAIAGTRETYTYCGSLPSELYIKLQVIRYADNHRTVWTEGYGIGYNGYKYQVTGPKEWDGNALIYNRTSLMDVNTFYGVNYTPANKTVSHVYETRVYSGSRTCDA